MPTGLDCPLILVEERLRYYHDKVVADVLSGRVIVLQDVRDEPIISPKSISARRVSLSSFAVAVQVDQHSLLRSQWSCEKVTLDSSGWRIEKPKSLKLDHDAEAYRPSATASNGALSTRRPAFEMRAGPVIPVADAVRVELEVIAWRDGLKRTS